MERELGVSLRDVEAAEAETVRRLAADLGAAAAPVPAARAAAILRHLK